METLSAKPVKSFFVSMLTRDVHLDDAILDLIDNCIDGALRQIGKKKYEKTTKPYAKYWCSIHMDESKFVIEDNCGGIPSALREYAFRFGRPRDTPKDDLPTVGVYGIGLKRALFKIGRDAIVETHPIHDDPYAVHFSPQWIDAEDTWDLQVEKGKKLTEPGTRITVEKLHAGVKTNFGQKALESDLVRRIGGHYAFIIDQGFEIRVNGTSVEGRPIRLAFSKAGIEPFVYEEDFGPVHVTLAVGLTRPSPSEQDEKESLEGSSKFSSLDAGWTVVCNDRAVLYCDRSEWTGWGEAGVPGYHTQFIGISGLVEFQSDDPSKLPTTTTKRGIDLSSTLYLRVKNKMREGMKIFTGYTYQWRGQRDVERKHIIEASMVPAREAIEKKRSQLRKLPNGSGKQYKPTLPRPEREPTDEVRISFTRPDKQVSMVRAHMELPSRTSPSEVGQACFDAQYARASK
jgi:hypothetical protein